jgi:hypothetical protein
MAGCSAVGYLGIYLGIKFPFGWGFVTILAAILVLLAPFVVYDKSIGKFLRATCLVFISFSLGFFLGPKVQAFGQEDALSCFCGLFFTIACISLAFSERIVKFIIDYWPISLIVAFLFFVFVIYKPIYSEDYIPQVLKAGYFGAGLYFIFATQLVIENV